MSDGNLNHFVNLDDVVFLDVVVVLQEYSAFEAGADFPDVVLEAAQAGDGTLVHLAAVAAHPGARTPAHDAVGDVRTGDVALAGNADDLAHGGVTDYLLLVLGFDLAADHALHVLDQVVDYPVRAERNALAFGRLDDASGRVHAEGEHAGISRAGQQQVALGGRADFGQHDVEVDFLDAVGFLFQDAAERFERTLGVCPQDDVERHGPAFAEQVRERQVPAADFGVLPLLAFLGVAEAQLLGCRLV